MPALAAGAGSVGSLPDWTKKRFIKSLQAVLKALGLKLGKLAQPMRVAVTGGTVSPPIDVTLCLIGHVRQASLELARFDI